MAEEKTTFVRMNVRDEAKREIDIIAASDKRDVYIIVDEMLAVYKAVRVGKLPRRKRGNDMDVPEIPVIEVIATH